MLKPPDRADLEQAEEACHELPRQLAHARERVAEYRSILTECRELEAEIDEAT